MNISNITLNKETIKINEICSNINTNFFISAIGIFILFLIYIKTQEYLNKKLEKKEINIKQYIKTIKYLKILFYASIPLLYFIIYIKYISNIDF